MGGKNAGPDRPVSVFIRASHMLTVVIVIHLIIVLAMIGVVLLQKSEGGGLGVGSSGGFLTSRGTANVLTRTTAFLAIAFFVTSLTLSWIASFERKPTSILNTGGGAPVSQPEAPAGPSTPLSQPGGGGLLNQLGGGQQSPQPPAPPAGGPQVPQSQ
jgi:preprotein translocase subunit SecG